MITNDTNRAAPAHISATAPFSEAGRAGNAEAVAPVAAVTALSMAGRRKCAEDGPSHNAAAAHAPTSHCSMSRYSAALAGRVRAHANAGASRAVSTVSVTRAHVLPRHAPRASVTHRTATPPASTASAINTGTKAKPRPPIPESALAEASTRMAPTSNPIATTAASTPPIAISQVAIRTVRGGPTGPTVLPG